MSSKSKVRLTEKAIDGLMYVGTGSSMCVYWDSKVQSFGVRVFPSGVKSFVLYYRNQLGRQRWMTIARVDEISLEDARERALRARLDIHDGLDPVADREALRSDISFQEYASTYLQHARIKKQSWREDERRLKKYVFPKLGRLGLKAVSRRDVSALHASVGQHSIYEANRCLALLSVMFSHALKSGLIEANIPNPAKGIDKFKEKARERFVSNEELISLFKVLKSYPHIHARNAVVLYLLTGLRKQELLRAKWSDIDLHRSVLRLPQTKAGRPQEVPLTPEAIQIFQQLPRLAGNSHVFPGQRPGKPLAGIREHWEKIRDAAGISDVTIHDLRRTVGSHLAQSGTNLILIKEILRHKDLATTEIYTRFAASDKRKALEAHSKRLQEVMMIADADGQIA